MLGNATGPSRYIRSISTHAKAKIIDFINAANFQDQMPSIVMSRILPDGNWELKFGFVRKDDVLEDDIVFIGGLEVAIAVPEEILKNLSIGELNYDNGNFILL